MSTPVEPIAYTIREAARMLEVSERTIRRAIASGRLRRLRIGRCVRIRREALEQFMSEPEEQVLSEKPTAKAGGVPA